MEAIDEVVRRIPEVRAENMPAGGRKASTPSLDVELVVSSNPTFAAAEGAAFWLRTMMDRSYCNYSASAEDIYSSDQVSILDSDHFE